MCCVERGGNINRNGCGAIWVEMALTAKNLREAPPIHVLHDDERRTVLLALIEDSDNVLMVQAGDKLCFSAKPLDEGLVLGQRRIEDLHCYRTVEELISCEEDVG